jgi:hypothetical protein
MAANHKRKNTGPADDHACPKKQKPAERLPQFLLPSLALKDVRGCVEFVHEELLKNMMLTCAICHEILDDPVVTKCNHPFCRDCLQRSLRHADKCPTCRTDIQQPSDYKANPILMSQIQQLTLVKCCSAEMMSMDQKVPANPKCTWKNGTLEALLVHLPLHCEDVVGRCYACNEAVIQNQWNKHASDLCIYRLIECVHCRRPVPWISREEHEHKQCLEAKTQCPLGCAILRKEERQHIRTCPQEKIDCPLKCTQSILRGELPKHLQDSTFFGIHFSQLAMQYIEKAAENVAKEEDKAEGKEHPGIFVCTSEGVHDDNTMVNILRDRDDDGYYERAARILATTDSGLWYKVRLFPLSKAELQDDKCNKDFSVHSINLIPFDAKTCALPTDAEVIASPHYDCIRNLFSAREGNTGYQWLPIASTAHWTCCNSPDLKSPGCHTCGK